MFKQLSVRLPVDVIEEIDKRVEEFKVETLMPVSRNKYIAAILTRIIRDNIDLSI